MNYDNLKKSELIALLKLRDARIEAAITAYKALQAEHAHKAPVKWTEKKLTLKPVKAFVTKDELMAWAGDKISSFVITHNEVSKQIIANLREWK